MLINYFKIAFRILWNSKTFLFINICGLAIGLAASLMILQYISFEKSFDQFHKHKENLYFLSMVFDMSDGTQDYRQNCHPAIGPLFQRELPEIEEYCRIFNWGKDNGATVTNISGEKPIVFYDSESIVVDKNFFEIFSFDLSEGDPHTVFESSNSIVLTESSAAKYFAEESAVGKRLTATAIFANAKPMEFIVTGIAADPPVNSSIKFSIVFDYPDDWKKRLETVWLHPEYLTMVKLNEQSDPVQLQRKFGPLIETPLEAIEEEHGLTENVIISPLDDLHFYSNSTSSVTINTSGDFRVVNLFTLIAILIMFITWSTTLIFLLYGP